MDDRVAVWHPRTKVWLEGDDAPRRRELGGWLKEHPGWKPMPASTAALVTAVVDGAPPPTKLLPDEAAAAAAMAAERQRQRQQDARAGAASTTERTRSPAPPAAQADEDEAAAAGVATKHGLTVTTGGLTLRSMPARGATGGAAGSSTPPPAAATATKPAEPSPRPEQAAPPPTRSAEVLLPYYSAHQKAEKLMQDTMAAAQRNLSKGGLGAPAASSAMAWHEDPPAGSVPVGSAGSTPLPETSHHKQPAPAPQPSASTPPTPKAMANGTAAYSAGAPPPSSAPRPSSGQLAPPTSEEVEHLLATQLRLSVRGAMAQVERRVVAAQREAIALAIDEAERRAQAMFRELWRDTMESAATAAATATEQVLRGCEMELLSSSALHETAAQLASREARLTQQAAAVATSQAQQAAYAAHHTELANVLRESEARATMERRQAVERAVHEAEQRVRASFASQGRALATPLAVPGSAGWHDAD